MPLERRLQILIDDVRHRRIVSVAQERGVSVAMVVREAIDRGLPSTDTLRRNAAARILDADDMQVGAPDELRAELEALRSRRA